MKETILLFNIQDRQKALKIEMALFPLHVRLRRIKPEDYGHTLGYLAGLKSNEAETTVKPSGSSDPAHPSDTETNGADVKESKNTPNHSATFPELDSEMIVFAFFEDNRLNQALTALRKRGAGPLPYKAILTPTNQNWTPAECFEEIRREHEAMNPGTGK